MWGRRGLGDGTVWGVGVSGGLASAGDLQGIVWAGPGDLDMLVGGVVADLALADDGVAGQLV